MEDHSGEKNIIQELREEVEAPTNWSGFTDFWVLFDEAEIIEKTDESEPGSGH